MKAKYTRICGNTEERINRFMRMCLEWQYDLKRGCAMRNVDYFKKYNIGKYNSRFFNDLKDAIIDRQWVISRMNTISAARQQRDRNLGIKSNRVIIEQFFAQDGTDVVTKGIHIKDDAILKNVAKSRIQKDNYNLQDVPDKILVTYMKKRGYIVLSEDKVLKRNQLS